MPKITSARNKKCAYTPRVPKIVDHESVRSRLIAQASVLFAERGYNALTTRTLSKELGVTTGGLYYYFPSKEALFAEVADHVTAGEVRGVRLALSPEDSPEVLAEGLLAYVRENEARMVRYTLLLTEYARLGRPRAADKAEATALTLARYREVLASQLGLDGPEGADAVLSFLRGLMLQRLLYGVPGDLLEQAPFLAALIRASRSS